MTKAESLMWSKLFLSAGKGGRMCGRGEDVWVQVIEGCLLQTGSSSLKCLLRLSLTGVDLMNCSYNYQTAGHGHYSAVAHVRMCVCMCVLTQPLAVLRRRSRQTGDPASVTPQVLLLRCCGNMPHLHCCISAWEEGRETEWGGECTRG